MTAKSTPADRPDASTGAGTAAPGPAGLQTAETTQRDRQRAAIETVALRLLDEGGPAALTSRAVSAAAGVQAMTLYRLYGDMDGLTQQAVARGYDQYIDAKTARKRAADPVDDLRAGWDLHVGFALAHPYVYAHIYGRHAPGHPNPATGRAAAVLRQLVERAARAGRLVCDAETAAWTIHAAGCGVALTLINTPPAQRDLRLSTACREAVLASLTAGADPSGPVESPTQHAVALTALLGDDPAFTAAERTMLVEWLGRIADRRTRTRRGSPAPPATRANKP